jgi:hypothetical protein
MHASIISKRESYNAKHNRVRKIDDSRLLKGVTELFTVPPWQTV